MAIHRWIQLAKAVPPPADHQRRSGQDHQPTTTLRQGQNRQPHSQPGNQCWEQHHEIATEGQRFPERDRHHTDHHQQAGAQTAVVCQSERSTCRELALRPVRLQTTPRNGNTHKQQQNQLGQRPKAQSPSQSVFQQGEIRPADPGTCASAHQIGRGLHHPNQSGNKPSSSDQGGAPPAAPGIPESGGSKQKKSVVVRERCQHHAEAITQPLMTAPAPPGHGHQHHQEGITLPLDCKAHEIWRAESHQSGGGQRKPRPGQRSPAGQSSSLSGDQSTARQISQPRQQSQRDGRGRQQPTPEPNQRVIERRMGIKPQHRQQGRITGLKTLTHGVELIAPKARGINQ